MITSKICNKCGEDLPLHAFHKDKKLTGGVAGRCKQCRKKDAVTNYQQETPEYKLWYRAKRRAQVKSRDFNIELIDIVIPETCPILKIPMDVPSLDRKDSNKGYIKGNIQVISNRANMLKNNASIEELRLVLVHLCEVK